MSALLLDILARYVSSDLIVKASANKGGEYHSPCPKCGGKDRFCVFPEQVGGELAQQHGVLGTWSCPRGCQAGGDTLSFLMWAGDMSFREACAELHMDLPEQDRKAAQHYRPLRPRTPQAGQSWTPTTYALPSATWRAQATKLTLEAHGRLLAEPNILSYLAQRGLPLAAVHKYQLGYIEREDKSGTCIYRQRSAFGLALKTRSNGTTVRALRIPRGITIPCWQQDEVVRLRIRRRNIDLIAGNDTKYLLVPQEDHPYSAPLQLFPAVQPDLATWVVVESELDAMAVHHACGGMVGVLSVLTVAGKPDQAAHAALGVAPRILLALDFDQDAAGENKTAKHWLWWKQQYAQVKLWPVPQGKDPGEAFAAGVDLRAWVAAALPASVALPAPAAPLIHSTVAMPPAPPAGSAGTCV